MKKALENFTLQKKSFLNKILKVMDVMKVMAIIAVMKVMAVMAVMKVMTVMKYKKHLKGVFYEKGTGIFCGRHGRN